MNDKDYAHYLWMMGMMVHADQEQREREQKEKMAEKNRKLEEFKNETHFCSYCHDRVYPSTVKLVEVMGIDMFEWTCGRGHYNRL